MKKRIITKTSKIKFKPFDNYGKVFKGMKWQLADVYGSEVSYHLANYHYKKDERLIYDATVNGKLDVFPKLAFEEALKMAKKK